MSDDLDDLDRAFIDLLNREHPGVRWVKVHPGEDVPAGTPIAYLIPP